MARLEKPTQLLPEVVQPDTIRPLIPADGVVAAEVFFDAVHSGAADVYTLEQRLAWAGDAPDVAAWMRRFQSLSGFVAVCDGVMVGFMTLDSDGYIDLAFVHSQHAGHGIGRLLYAEVEVTAAAKGITLLTTQASIKARPFFARMGWQLDIAQVVVKHGIELVNFKMSKVLI